MRGLLAEKVRLYGWVLKQSAAEGRGGDEIEHQANGLLISGMNPERVQHTRISEHQSIVSEVEQIAVYASMRASRRWWWSELKNL